MLWYWILPFTSLLSNFRLIDGRFFFFWPQVMDMLGPSLWDVWNTSGQA